MSRSFSSSTNVVSLGRRCCRPDTLLLHDHMGAGTLAFIHGCFDGPMPLKPAL
jgi:hypothetical protein